MDMKHKMVWALFTIPALFAMLFVFGVEAAQQRVQAVYKTFKITNSDVGVACRNGAEPQVNKQAGGKIVVISCEN
jgi:hypothetical protein